MTPTPRDRVKAIFQDAAELPPAKRAAFLDSFFGLALAIEQEPSSLLRARQVLGTADSMAPEQLLFEPITTATDIYALGLVMYELVAGAKAFPEGRPLENALQRVMEKPTPPRSHSAEYQCRMERCLSRDPADRPASAMEVVAALGGQQLPPIKCLCTETDLRQELAKRFRQSRNQCNWPSGLTAQH